ncbi:MAG: type IV secretory system conjugative DNA transfer family protein [Bacteroidetes bacterium]|nr:type IV secretory system conjugative DNA transfer family protein [Bacteroidota bacterium]
MQYLGAASKVVSDVIVDKTLTAIESFGEHDNRTYSAKFGDECDLLDGNHGGFCVTGSADGCLSRKTSYENVLCIGPIGSRKTSALVIPSALSIGSSASMIINCPSGDAKIVAPYLTSVGSDVQIIKFDDPYNSSSFNPYDFLETKSDCFKLAFLLAGFLKPGTGDNFWQVQTSMLLYILIAILNKQEARYRNIYNLKFLLNRLATNQRSLDKLFARADNDLAKEYEGFIAMEDKVLKSIIASTQSALQLWYSDAVCKSTAVNTVDLKTIRRKPCCIIVETPTLDSKMYSGLISIFFDTALRVLMSRLPQKDDLDVFIIADEASTLNIEFGNILNNLRKYRCGLMTLWQSDSQIDHNFGIAEAESIRNASRTKVYLSGQGLKTSQDLESLLGKTEYVQADGKVKVRPLMLSQDIRNMKPDQAIVISAHCKHPLKVKVTPYFEQPFLKLKTDLPPFKYRNTLIPDVIPILKLDEGSKAK